MPKCKYCKKSITQFDKEICPFCGGKKPIDENILNTADITQSIDTIPAQDEVKINFKPKTRLLTSLLCMFLGVFGIDDLYLGFKLRFFIRLVINAGAYVGLCFLFSKIKTGYMVYLWPFMILFALYFILGIVLFFIKNRKDSNGVFLV